MLILITTEIYLKEMLHPMLNLLSLIQIQRLLNHLPACDVEKLDSFTSCQSHRGSLRSPIPEKYLTIATPSK